MLARMGAARVVLLGESSHGTSEFYRMRARISRELILKKGFRIVALEADWPDAARIDQYVRHSEVPTGEWKAFSRFPSWMWRNEEFEEFVQWLRVYNRALPPHERVAVYGLDLYSLYTSIEEVLRYLHKTNRQTEKIARQRYECLSPWREDLSLYGHDVLMGRVMPCDEKVVANLEMLSRHRLDLGRISDPQLFDALQNAALVADAEQYYRKMYMASYESWNLRDKHMFQTLRTVMEFHGHGSRAVVWEHNSHIGNGRATEFSSRGEFNLGQLCRDEFGPQAYLIGFGTDHGTVAAASEWDGPMEVKRVRPSHPRSFERVFHETGECRFMLPLRELPSGLLRRELLRPRLERAIGVVYRPETELVSHYFEARLVEQFDEYIWFDGTVAVKPLNPVEVHGMPETYPFGV